MAKQRQWSNISEIYNNDDDGVSIVWGDWSDVNTYKRLGIKYPSFPGNYLVIPPEFTLPMLMKIFELVKENPQLGKINEIQQAIYDATH